MSKLTFNPIIQALFELSNKKQIVLGTDRGFHGVVIDDNCQATIMEHGVCLTVTNKEGFKMELSFEAATVHTKGHVFWLCVFNNFSNASKSFEDLGITSPKGKVQSVSYEKDQIVVNAKTEDGYLSYEVHEANAFPLYKGYID